MSNSTNILFAQNYLPTYIIPGSMARLIVTHGLPPASFRGRLTIPYSVGTIYSPYHWTTMDIDQSGTGITSDSAALYDSGWIDLPPPNNYHNGNVSDILPQSRLRFDMSGLDMSGVTADGQLYVKLMFRIPTSAEP